MFNAQKKKERTEHLRGIAGDLGMDFQEKDEWGTKALLKEFNLFRKGHSRKITNILQKTSGLLEEKICIMDYQYTITANNYSKTFYQTAFFLQSKQLALPEMLLKPEHFFHKIGA